MARRPLPSRDELLNLLHYDDATGELFWRSRTPEQFGTGGIGQEAAARSFNKRFAGKRAFTTLSCYGYATGHIMGRTMFSHRIIWRMVTGEVPDVIDHINGVRTDNRWSNLREGDQRLNMSNVRMRRNNTSGVTGVFWNPEYRRWRGRLVVDGKHKNLGYFNCLGAAIAARKAAMKRFGFLPEHGFMRKEMEITAVRAAD